MVTGLCSVNKSLLNITDLRSVDLHTILELSKKIAQGECPPHFTDRTIASLFYEHSTRTRVSFELAVKRLNLIHTHIDIQQSSVAKGETFLDTVLTLAAYGVDAFVIRHKEEGLMQQARDALSNNCVIINAGEGMMAHPTQALLDIFTIKQCAKMLSEMKIVILGDIRHSRVIKSLVVALQKMDVKNIVFCAPDYFLPDTIPQHITVESNIDIAMEGADVIYGVRVQKERINQDENLPIEDYIASYCLTKKRLGSAKPNSIVMHPGPVNRGVEMDSEVIDLPGQSKILTQVENGIYVRMAILLWALNLQS
jgi:aspartate carbamoyltransferase catalytic subunit